MRVEVKDLSADSSKPLAKIETAKTIIAVHLARAKKAAVSGQEKLGKILEQMAEIEGSLQRAREIPQR